MKIRQILKDSIDIFKRQPVALIGEFLSAILIYIVAILAYCIIIFLLSETGSGSTFLVRILGYLVASTFTGMLLNISLQSVRGNIGIKNLKVPFSFIWKNIVYILLMVLVLIPIYLITIMVITSLIFLPTTTKTIVVAGTIMLVVLLLLLWIKIKVSFTRWILIDKPKINLFQAIGESWTLTNGNMWSIIKLLIVIFLINIAVVLIPVLSIKFIETLNLVAITLIGIISLMIIIFLIPVQLILLAKLYDEMVIRKGNSSSDNISGVKSIESQDIEKITIMNEVKKEQVEEHDNLEIKEDKINLTKEDNLVNKNTQDIIKENIQKSIENKSEENEEE